VRLRLPKLFRLQEDGAAPLHSPPLAESEAHALHAARRQRVKILLRDWYRLHAEAYFGRRLVELRQCIPWLEHVPPYRLQTMRKQWGSCSPTGMLLLNPHLIKAPRRCIDYVLTHEICHLVEHNHSPAFYRLLEACMHDWQKVKGQLDDMAELLLNE
jgi:predicted metal-dependent hydrolase